MFRLALTLGKTVKELVELLTLTELMEWIAYYNLEPWGQQIDGMRSALNTSAVYNAGLMQADPKKLRNKPFKPEQFYVGVNNRTTGSKPKQSWQEQKAIISKAFGNQS